MAKKKPAPEKSEAEEYVSAMRSRNMSRVKNADTKIEVAFRRALWRSGIRYRKNYKPLPGKPDIVVTKHRIAIFCDGEFWHGKNWPAVKEKLRTRRSFWVGKIERTIERDTDNDKQLEALGWTVLRFWGKDIEKNLELCVADVKDAILQARVDSAGIRFTYDPYCDDEAYAAAESPPEFGEQPVPAVQPPNR